MSQVFTMNTSYLVAVLLVFLSSVYADQVRYDNFRVYRVTINNEDQLLALKNLPQGDGGYEFLYQKPETLGQTIEVVVPMMLISEFEQLSLNMELDTKLMIENLQDLIDKGSVKSRADGFGWDEFYTLSEIYDWLDTLPDLYPGVVSKIVGGESNEGRLIEGVFISMNPENPGIFIEANIHAREWITSASATWVINQLLTSTDPEVVALLENFNWYVFPVTNPDGFEFSHTNDRLWRKTRSRQGLICWGVDPNRNWDIFWQAGGEGSSDDICEETFAGPEAFSEKEVLTLSEYITSISDKIQMYLSFHSAINMIIFPWGHTDDQAPNYEDLFAVATEGNRRLFETHGFIYKVGPIRSTLYPTTGTSVDWTYGILDIKLSYLLEFRDSDAEGNYYLFVPPPSEIVPNSEEILQAIIGMAATANDLGYFNIEN